MGRLIAGQGRPHKAMKVVLAQRQGKDLISFDRKRLIVVDLTPTQLEASADRHQLDFIELKPVHSTNEESQCDAEKM